MALTTAERTDIIKLVVAMFNAAPGATYLSDLTVAYEANGRSLANLAAGLAQTPAYKTLNPAFDTAAEFAARLLQPFGLQANTTAVDFVTAKFNAGVNKGQIALDVAVALNATTATEFADAKAILNNKAAVAEYYSVTKGVAATTVSTLQGVIASVTKDAASVTTANAAVDSTAAASTAQSFTLTKNDAVLTDTTSNSVSPAGKLSGGNDNIDALNLLASTVVIRDTSTSDADKLSALLTAAVAPLLTNIETVDLTFVTAGADLQMTNISGTKSITINGGSAVDGKVSSLSPTAAPTITLGGTTKVTTLAQTTDAGTADVLNVVLAGSKGGLTITDAVAGGALETLNITSGTSANTLTLVADGTNTATVDKTVVTGASDVTFIGAVDGQISGTNKFTAIDASAATGKVALQVGANSTVTTITDTAITLTNHKNISKVILNDDTVVTVTGGGNGLTVDLNSDAAFASLTVTGSTAVATASSNADVLNVNLNGLKTAGTSSNITGALTFTGFETLNIKSTGIAHSIGALTTTGSATALDTVNITGDKDLTLAAAPTTNVEKIDATGFTGKLIMTAGGADLLVLNGGDGNDTLFSGANAVAATLVNAGKGDDTITVGANTDTLTLGDGKDTVSVTALANTYRAQGDSIADFVSGTDSFKVGATIKAATTATTLAVQTITTGATLQAALGNGTYATADAAYVVAVNVTGASYNGTYLVLNNNTAGYADGADGVIKLTGVTTLAAADFVA